MLDYQGIGMSIAEVSHRGKDFLKVAQEANETLTSLLKIPETHAVLYLQGGATLQFAAVPMNLSKPGGSVAYVESGAWSEKAIAEASKFCNVEVIASSKSNSYRSLPSGITGNKHTDFDYIHVTMNETIHGLEFHDIPDTGDIPLVADMSSTLLSRPLDVSKFGLIYAGAQKNLGIAGLTIVIVRKDLLGRGEFTLPRVIDYKAQYEGDSMLNTPPTFSWYVSGLVFKWIAEEGGLEAMGERNFRKSNKLYSYIDTSTLYQNYVEASARSWMNLPFNLSNDELNQDFLDAAQSNNLCNLKGHRQVGGMRASLYNAISEDDVDILLAFMQSFAREKGYT